MKLKKQSLFFKLFPFLKIDTNNNLLELQEKSKKLEHSENESRQAKLKEIEENNKINLHVQHLIEVNDYSRIISLFEHLPADKLNTISEENYKTIVKKIVHLFSGDGVNINSKDNVSLIEFVSHPVISQQIAQTFNNIKTEPSSIDYSIPGVSLIHRNLFYSNEVSSPLSEKRGSFINTARKLFTVDYDNRRLIYNGLSSLTENEKKLLDISFKNLTHNLSKKPYEITSENQMFLLSDDYSLLAFLIENPEFQGNQFLIDKSKYLTYSFSHDSTIFGIIKETVEKRLNISTELYNEIASEIFNKEFSLLTVQPKVINEHNDVLTTLTKRYGDQTSYLIKSANLSADLSNDTHQVFNNLQEWKKLIGPNGNQDILSFIENSTDTLKSALTFYKEIKDNKSHQESADNLIKDLLKNINNTINQHLEQTIESVSNQNKIAKRMY